MLVNHIIRNRRRSEGRKREKMENLQKEYEKQVTSNRMKQRISGCMILVGIVCMVIALLNRSNTPLMILFFALTVASCVVGVVIGEQGKKKFSTYVGQTVTRKVLEQHFKVDEFIMSGETPLDEIHKTELHWNYNRIIGSRVIRGSLDGVHFQCSNVVLDETVGTANKNTRVFCGQYVFLDLKEKADGIIRVIDKENPVRKPVQGCRPVKISSVQEFDDLFEVFATDQAAARKYLTEERREALLELKRLLSEKGGEEKAQLNLMVKGRKLCAALGDGIFLFHRQNEKGTVDNIIEYNQLDAEFVQKALRLLMI